LLGQRGHQCGGRTRRVASESRAPLSRRGWPDGDPCGRLTRRAPGSNVWAARSPTHRRARASLDVAPASPSLEEKRGMARFMELKLEKRGVSCVARLLDAEAPLTCDIVWNGLPIGGDAWHAKYAMNEVYCLVPPIQGDAPGLEHATTMPIPGDV